MKYLYIVSWALTVEKECPDFKADKYGRYPSTHCLVLHLGKDEHQKVFNDRKEAFDFYTNGLSEAKDNEIHIMPIGGIFDLKIDSVKTN